MISVRNEFKKLMDGIRKLDKQTVFVLVSCIVLVFIQLQYGRDIDVRRFLRDALPESMGGLARWGWWFGLQGVTGFVLPVAVLVFVFRNKLRDIGLGLGDWRFAGTLALIYLPFVIIGTWILSDGADFQSAYPHFTDAATNWKLFLGYELLYIFYWIGWEYLWRGYVLFGTARTFGAYAIVIQMVPFALLHADKPVAEAYLSILGGLALGALVWRCRSFWIAVPIHAVQMLLIDFFCSMRIRTGVSGKGLSALIDMFS